MAIFTHVAVGTNDLAKARAFYDAVLAPLGLKRIKDLGDRGSCWGQSVEEFMVLPPADGKPACPANGGTVSFEAPSRAAVADFHKAALAAGGPLLWGLLQEMVQIAIDGQPVELPHWGWPEGIAIGAAVAGVMLLVILTGVLIYLFGWQRRLQNIEY